MVKSPSKGKSLRAHAGNDSDPEVKAKAPLGLHAEIEAFKKQLAQAERDRAAAAAEQQRLALLVPPSDESSVPESSDSEDSEASCDVAELEKETALAYSALLVARAKAVKASRAHFAYELFKTAVRTWSRARMLGIILRSAAEYSGGGGGAS